VRNGGCDRLFFVFLVAFSNITFLVVVAVVFVLIDRYECRHRKRCCGLRGGRSHLYGHRGNQHRLIWRCSVAVGFRFRFRFHFLFLRHRGNRVVRFHFHRLPLCLVPGSRRGG